MEFFDMGRMRGWMQQITVEICRFVVHTGWQAVAIDWNFDVEKSDWNFGNFPGVFQCRVKGVDRSYKMIKFFSARWSSTNTASI